MTWWFSKCTVLAESLVLPPADTTCSSQQYVTLAPGSQSPLLVFTYVYTVPTQRHTNRHKTKNNTINLEK